MKRTIPPVSADQPSWYQPEAPLGSAVRHVASLGPWVEWAAVYFCRGRSVVLGPSLGKRPGPKKRLVLPLNDSEGKVLGRLEVGRSGFTGPGRDEELAQLRRIAQELAERWPRNPRSPKT